jgi:hypothetical protein
MREMISWPGIVFASRASRWREVAACLEEQRAVVAQVPAATESLFLDCAAHVERLTRAGDALQTASHQMLEAGMGAERGEAQLRAAAVYVRSLLEQLEGSEEALRGPLQRLKECARTLEKLRVVQQSVARIMSLLRIVQIKFRTETAQLPEQVRAAFLTLSEQIMVLESRVGESFEGKFHRLEQARATLVAGALEVERRLEKHQTRHAAMEAEIRRSLARMEDELSRNRDRERTLTAMSRTLADQVNAVTGSLQVHDIVAQKLSHVDSAFVQMCGEVSAAAGRSSMVFSRADRKGLRRRFFEFSRIETSQMKAAGEDLRAASESVQAAADAVLGTVGESNGASEVLGNFREMCSSVTTMAATMVQSLEELKTSLNDAAEGMESSQRTILPAVGSLEHLLVAMEDVRQEIRMVALNAQIQAIQNGEGTGLEVLAARVVGISLETEEAGEQVARAVEETSQAVSEAAALLEGTAPRLRAELTRLGIERTRHASGLRGMQEEVQAQMRAMESAVDQIREEATHLRERVAGLLPFASCLAPAAERIQLAGARLGAEDIATLEAQSADGAWMESKYTMASEREVHRGALSATGAVAGMAVASAAAEACCPVEAGDVELF